VNDTDIPTCSNCGLACEAKTCHVCGTANPYGTDALDVARDALDTKPIPRGLQWVADKWPDVAWLCGLKRRAREFYRHEPHRTQLIASYPDVPTACWPLLLDHAED
jgi:hypothetical protein